MVTQSIHRCWLCGKDVDISTCKIDEYGEAVHAACYMVRLALEDRPRTSREAARFRFERLRLHRQSYGAA